MLTFNCVPNRLVQDGAHDLIQFEKQRASSEKRKVLSKLNTSQDELIREVHYDFDLLAADSKKLSEFCVELIYQNEERFFSILSCFTKDTYDTSYDIKLRKPVAGVMIRILRLLDKFPSLSRLSLERIDSRDEELIAFMNKAGALESLSIKECENLTQRGFRSIKGALEKLSITKSKTFDDVALDHILRSCKDLKILSCKSCPLVTFETVCEMNRVVHVTVDACGITSAGLTAISKSFYALQCLTLSACKELENAHLSDFTPPRTLKGLELVQIDITQPALENLLSKIVSISFLTLSNLSRIPPAIFMQPFPFKDCKVLLLSLSTLNDSGLLAIKNECKRVEDLDISYCYDLTVDGFKQGYPENLESLDASCTEIDIDGVKVLLKTAQNLLKVRVATCEHLPVFTHQNWLAVEQLRKVMKDENAQFKPVEKASFSECEGRVELIFEIDL